MAVSKAKKVEILADLESALKNASSVAFTSNTKLTVEEITNLRRDLRKVDARFVLAKKTLIKIAFKNVYNVEIQDDLLPGQVAVLISSGDKIAAFSVVNKYANDFRKEEKIKFVGAYLDGEVYDAKGASKLATIPSREVLLAKLLGSMKAPISGLARFFDGAKKELETKDLTRVGDLTVLNVKPVEEAKAEVKEEKVETPVEEVKTEETPALVVEKTPVETIEETTTEETPAE